MPNSDDLEFAKRFALMAGTHIVNLRRSTRRRKKLDRTDVTDVDVDLNVRFIRAVDKREGTNASVQGEERSRAGNRNRVWIIDPVDGTNEYVDDDVPDTKRTTSFALCLLENGRLVLSVVNNPFRREMFTAMADGVTRLNGRQLTCSSTMIRRGAAYDYCDWEGARFRLNRLELSLGKPLGHQSAIYQACTVAAGRSTFAAFPGNTIHDIAPAALIVMQAAGRVTDLRGRPLKLGDLSSGALFSNRPSQMAALHAIANL